MWNETNISSLTFTNIFCALFSYLVSMNLEPPRGGRAGWGVPFQFPKHALVFHSSLTLLCYILPGALLSPVCLQTFYLRHNQSFHMPSDAPPGFSKSL